MSDDHATADADSAAESGDGSGTTGIQVFAAPSDAPRVRWTTDLISAAVSAALALLPPADIIEGPVTLHFVLKGWLADLGQPVESGS